jgi:hypothetical protein
VNETTVNINGETKSKEELDYLIREIGTSLRCR